MTLVLFQITFAEDLRITEMISGEGEKVPFTEVLRPDGNVEDWLLEVERVMRESLRKILSDALEDYKTVSSLFARRNPSCTLFITRAINISYTEGLTVAYFAAFLGRAFS